MFCFKMQRVHDCMPVSAMHEIWEKNAKCKLHFYMQCEWTKHVGGNIIFQTEACHGCLILSRVSIVCVCIHACVFSAAQHFQIKNHLYKILMTGNLFTQPNKNYHNPTTVLFYADDNVCSQRFHLMHCILFSAFERNLRRTRTLTKYMLRAINSRPILTRFVL